MDEIISGNTLKERTEGKETKCKTCGYKGNCMECELCELWECQDCTNHRSQERKKIKKALEIKGIFWTCKDCNNECKMQGTNKNGCGSCGSKDKKLFYMNCDYCQKWLCEICLKKKEDLNESKCKPIEKATDTKGENKALLLNWACNECRKDGLCKKERNEGHVTEEEEKKEGHVMGEEVSMEEYMGKEVQIESKKEENETEDEHTGDKEKEKEGEETSGGQQRMEGEEMEDNKDEDKEELNVSFYLEMDYERRQKIKEVIKNSKKLMKEYQEGQMMHQKEIDHLKRENEKLMKQLENMKNKQDNETEREEKSNKTKVTKGARALRDEIVRMEKEIRKKTHLILNIREGWEECRENLANKDAHFKRICEVAANLAHYKEELSEEKEIYLEGIKKEYEAKRKLMSAIRKKISDKKEGKEGADIESLEHLLEEIKMEEGGRKKTINPEAERKEGEVSGEQEEEARNMRLLKEFTNASEEVIKFYLVKNGNELSTTIIDITEAREQEEKAEKKSKEIKRGDKKENKAQKEENNTENKEKEKEEENIKRLMEVTMVEEEKARKFLQEFKELNRAAIEILKEKSAEKRKINTEARKKTKEKDNCTKCQKECRKCGISVCTGCAKSGRVREGECPKCKEIEDKRKREESQYRRELREMEEERKREESQFRREERICPFYLQGRCRFGRYCREKHTTQTREAVICKYYEENRCRFGNRCRNTHQRQRQEKETRPENQIMETEEALKEGLLGANTQGDLTCKICDIRVVSWRAHSGGSKHKKNEKNEIDRQERMLNEIKRKKREEEDHELSLEAALQKGIVKAKSCGMLTCEICKAEVRIWNQHSRSERHRKEKLKKDEKYEENRGEKDTKNVEEEKQEEAKEKENEEKKENEVTMEELEKMLFNLEAQPGSKEEGEKRTSYFLQQARKFAQEIEV